MTRAHLWQGFAHEWLREVAGFRLPHRISRLSNHIDDARDDGAHLHAAMAPGVDGNFMRPEGFASVVDAPRLDVHRAEARFALTDTIVDHPRPHAETDATQRIRVSLPGLSDDEEAIALLRGFAFASSCDPRKQPPELPCNSNGLWPYRFGLRIDTPKRAHDALEVPISLTVHRGWTPTRGGVPVLEEKPLNRCLDFSVRVFVTVLRGPRALLHGTRGKRMEQEAQARSARVPSRAEALTGLPGYPNAIVGLHGFAFELDPLGERGAMADRGRYLSGLCFVAKPGRYHEKTGTLAVRHEAQVYLPRTVLPARARYETEATLVQLGPGATATPRVRATARICSPSRPEAPFFSKWDRCECDGLGPARTSDIAPFERR